MSRILNTSAPVNRQHGLNQGRLAWWMGLPHSSGGKFLYDLMDLWPGTLSTTSTVVPAWTSRNPRPGAVGPSLSFDGSTSYVGVANFSLASTNTATISCWAYSAASQSSFANVVFGRAPGVGGAVGTGIAVNGAGGYAYQWAGGGGTGSQYGWSGGPTVVNGVWTFLCLVITPTNAVMYSGTGGPLTAYTNAVANTAQVVGGLNLGYDAFNASRLWNGQIDDASIYNFPLTSWQAESLYREGLAGYPNTLGWHEPWMLGVPAAGGIVAHPVYNIQFAYPHI